MIASGSSKTSVLSDRRHAVISGSPEVSVIIVNWNSKGFIRQCLKSLFKHSHAIAFEVVVVDNASDDGCGEMLAKEFPSVVFVQSEKNVGFGMANNLGVRHSKGSTLLFLNPDTELLENSIKILMQRSTTLPQVGALGCRLLTSDHSVDTHCVQSFPTVLNQFLDSYFLRRSFPRASLWGIAALYTDDPRPSEVEAISGACILIKKDVFLAIGGFSEIYFMYGEDLDLCFKVKRAGFRVYFVPDTSIVHHGGGSTQNTQDQFSEVMMRESVFRFLRSNRGAITASLYRLAMAVTSFSRMLLILPLLVVSGNRLVRHGLGSLRKWNGILKWSCGRKSWALHSS